MLFDAHSSTPPTIHSSYRPQSITSKPATTILSSYQSIPSPRSIMPPLPGTKPSDVVSITVVEALLSKLKKVNLFLRLLLLQHTYSQSRKPSRRSQWMLPSKPSRACTQPSTSTTTSVFGNSTNSPTLLVSTHLTWPLLLRCVVYPHSNPVTFILTYQTGQHLSSLSSEAHSEQPSRGPAPVIPDP